MANYLDANPNDAACIFCWKGQLVPIARNGALLALVNESIIHLELLAKPLPVQDYVVGLELLGYRFHIQKAPDDGSPVLFRQEPDLPPAWDAQFLRITEAFGPGRTDEVRVFVIERDGEL